VPDLVDRPPGTVAGLNFLAHADVAHRVSGDRPGQLLGAMLPDLVVMAGVRLPAHLPGELDAGRLLHHAVDDVFHGHAVFREGVGAIRRRLSSGGLGTGPARAAAHVGYELLLDGCVEWHGPLADAVDRSLGDADLLSAGLRRDEVDRWAALVARLRPARAWVPDPPTEELARRVERVLARRPRLALGPGQTALVLDALAAARPSVTGEGPALLEDVAAAVAERSREPRGALLP
jgi:hypothetical protein